MFGCSVYGRCTLARQGKDPAIPCCSNKDKVVCPDFTRDTFKLVAPVGTSDTPSSWEGRNRPRPWKFKVTCILPHLDTPEMLEACVGLIRLQTERPYLVIVDTGSPKDVCDRIEQLRGVDCEVHYVRGGGYPHSSEPVAVALDLGFARTNTEFIFLTHVDVFLKRRDAIAWLVGQCSEACPVVGYEMSDRSWLTDQWKGMVSHTFTALHTRTMLVNGITWHFERGRILDGREKDYHAQGWPDTESAANFVFRERGIVPKLLGPEPNWKAYDTELFIHVRSAPGMHIYGGGPSAYRAAQPGILAKALTEANDRISRWKRGEP